MKEYRWQNW